MSTVRFNDDIVLTLPYGWASKEGWHEGKKELRIAGPDADVYLSDSRDYECDINIRIINQSDSMLSQEDFAEKLKKLSEQAGEVKIQVQVGSSGNKSQVGGSGFQREHRVLINRSDLHTGYYTMGIIGKTVPVGVIITQKAAYALTTLKSESLASALRSFPNILNEVELLHASATPAEREAQRRAREQSEKERREREAVQRRREEEAARLEEQRQQAQKAARSEAKEKKIQQEKAKLEKEFARKKEAANKKLADAEQREQEARQALAALGFLQFGKKSEQKDRIIAAQKQAAEAKAALDAAEKAYNKAVYELTKPADIRKILQDSMIPGVTYAVRDLMELISSKCDEEVSEDQVKRIMSSFCNSGRVVKTTVKGNDYYTLA